MKISDKFPLYDVIVFNRKLSEEEDILIQSYLMGKCEDEEAVKELLKEAISKGGTKE